MHEGDVVAVHTRRPAMSSVKPERMVAPGAVCAAAAVVCVAAAVIAAPQPLLARAFIAACAIAVLFLQWKLAPHRLPVLLVVWLVPLGAVRRVVTMAVGGVGLDPLLLVAPAAWTLLLVDAVRRGALESRSALSTAVLALSGLTLVGAANTTQAPLLTGIGGLLFFLVPQMSFWTGRLLPTHALTKVLRATRVLVLLAAGYGVVQVVHGFLPWDARWLAQSGYVALRVGDAIRPFGTSSSSAEYAYLLGIGIVCWTVLGSRSAWGGRLAAVFLWAALVLSSSRGSVVLVLIALTLVAAARLGLRVVLALPMTAAALLLVPLAVGLIGPGAFGSDKAGTLVAHQAAGLANPLDPSSSTLTGHVMIVGQGLGSVLDHPIGQGTGVVSMSGSKFGGAEVQTEADLSNAAVALGLPGLVAFAAVAFLGLARAYRLASQSRDPVHLAVLGLLVATSLQWLNGGLYGVSWLPWLLLGWLDGRATREDTNPRVQTRTRRGTYK